MTDETIELPKITSRKLRSILNDEEKTAMAANLVYVSDNECGIERRSINSDFTYFFKEKEIKDDEELLRIKHLVIPPAWEKVWICAKVNGHLQATGFDTRNRKQYKYHLTWTAIRNNTKFFRMLDFGKALPSIRQKLKKDLNSSELSQEKVLALVVNLIEYTHIRIGNEFYEKEYGSFGLTTLKDKHVKIEGSKVNFKFKGKKGVKHSITMKNTKLAKLIKQCRDIPGKELFQYLDGEGNHHPIDSGMVNKYLQEISGGNFTAKDFRTWAGTVLAFRILKEAGYCETEAETKRQIVAALDKVSESLGNTRTVCKKYYVHPQILSLYQDKKLEKYCPDNSVISKELDGLFPEEISVMKILAQ
jgi:DNA topoisomerase-1